MAANLFENIPADLPAELVEILAAGPGARIERIVSRGHASPGDFWYDQDRDEFVLLLQGSAGLRFEGSKEILVLKPGDHLTIKAHVRHRVEWTDPDGETVWLTVHF